MTFWNPKFAGVKLSVVGLTVPSVRSELRSVHVTPAVGATVSSDADRDLAAALGRVEVRVRLHVDLRGLVVDVRHADVGRVQAAVAPVGAGRRGGDDRVRRLPSSTLSLTPVTVTVCGTFQLARRERQAGGRDRALGRVARRQADGHVGVGWVFSTT